MDVIFPIVGMNLAAAVFVGILAASARDSGSQRNKNTATSHTVPGQHHYLYEIGTSKVFLGNQGDPSGSAPVAYTQHPGRVVDRSGSQSTTHSL